jgi:hypothetical protein
VARLADYGWQERAADFPGEAADFRVAVGLGGVAGGANPGAMKSFRGREPQLDDVHAGCDAPRTINPADCPPSGCVRHTVMDIIGQLYVSGN